MLAIHSFDLPLTGKLTINDGHAVNEPVVLVEWKEEKSIRRPCRLGRPARPEAARPAPPAHAHGERC